MRREFSPRVRREIVERATNGNRQVTCEGCGLVLKPGAYEIDHVIPEALVIDKAKPLTAKDGQVLGACCHRGESGKTNRDVKAIAKSRRAGAKHYGYQRKPGRPMPGSKASGWKRRMDGTTERRT